MDGAVLQRMLKTWKHILWTGLASRHMLPNTAQSAVAIPPVGFLSIEILTAPAIYSI